MSQIFSYQIGVGEDEERLDKWLSVAVPTLSRSYIQKCIREERVLINGTPCKANYRLRVDDEVAFQIREAVSLPLRRKTFLFPFSMRTETYW